MSISSVFDRLHSKAKQNSWLWLFSIFCRFSLALGFIPAGIVKVVDERFASGLHAKHPMGHYLEALHLTGFYYTFIGIVQIAAAIFLLFPRTVTLGAFLYFPIILNICILTFATRFDGSMFTAPLMTLANLFLLGWNYEKWKNILPFNHLENYENFSSRIEVQPKTVNQSVFSGYGLRPLYTRFRLFLKQLFSDKFPFAFLTGVFAVTAFFMFVFPNIYSIKPRNTLPLCLKQFNGTNKTKAGEVFCSCIHQNGEPLVKCMNEFHNSPEDAD